jgi:hypothetical protein
MTYPLKFILVPALCAGAFLGFSSGVARAAEPAPAPPPPGWWDTFSFWGVVDAGFTGNADNPADGLNFGHLFTDKSGQPLLNQVLLTAQRPLDPKATGYDFGFKLQVMYGSDARYTHYLGECDYCINDRTQFTPVELWGVAHLPWLFSGGIDIKAGQWVTLEGAETIDPTTNYLYSHTYIFNFGIPFVETGILTISHVDPLLDIYAGVTTGVNTTIGYRGGDNNGAPAFVGGIGLNLFDGNLTILGSTHIGPELPDTSNPFGLLVFNNRINTALICGCNPNTALRYLNDITATWKVNDAFTLITDGNFIRDSGGNASGYGVAQYAIYTVNDILKLVGRLEIWRDNGSPKTGTGFFVAGFPGNFDFVNSEYGFNNTSFNEPPTTYLGLTVGANVSLPIDKGTPVMQSLTLRPEVRFDTSLSNTTPFGGVSVFTPPGGPGTLGFGVSTIGTKSSQFTFGGDIVLKFGT